MSAIVAALAVGLLAGLLVPPAGRGAAGARRQRRGARAGAFGWASSWARPGRRGGGGRDGGRDTAQAVPGTDSRRSGPEPVRWRIAQADAAREHLTRAAALLRSGATPPQAFAALAGEAAEAVASPGDGDAPAPGVRRHGSAAGRARTGSAGAGHPLRLAGRRGGATEERDAALLSAAWAEAATAASLALGSGEGLSAGRPGPRAGEGTGVGESWERLRWVCGIATRTGAPLAPLLERVAEDAAATADALRARQAGAAAAGTTRRILAWLPVGGLLLAQALGARPLEVLIGTVPGRVTALLGTAFWVVALLWSRRVIAMPEEERATGSGRVLDVEAGSHEVRSGSSTGPPARAFQAGGGLP